MPPGRAWEIIWRVARGGGRKAATPAGVTPAAAVQFRVAGRGQHLIDVVHVSGEFGRLALARPGQRDLEIGADAAGIFAEHDDAIGEQHGFLDVVGDDEDGLGRDGFLAPELQQFTAQILGGEDIEGGEGLVHEKDFGLDDQGPGKADALLHAAGEFLGIGLLEAVEADGVEDFEAALAALEGVDATSLERGFHVLIDGEPGEESEALKDDGDIGGAIADGFAVPEDLAGRGEGEAGEHAQQGTFAGAGGTEQGEDLSGFDGKIGGGDDRNGG